MNESTYTSLPETNLNIPMPPCKPPAKSGDTVTPDGIPNISEFDARLIAAAPELLDSLIELMKATENTWFDDKSMLKRACAAIEKATAPIKVAENPNEPETQ